jgi:hypothetical protein
MHGVYAPKSLQDIAGRITVVLAIVFAGQGAIGGRSWMAAGLAEEGVQRPPEWHL